jgi:hypothetical protein
MNRASCAKHRCGFLLRRAEMDAMRAYTCDRGSEPMAAFGN